MSPEIVQSMVFAKREGCPVNRSSSLTGRFSAIFRDFPNTGRPVGGKGYFSAGAAGFVSRRAEAGEKGGEAGVVGERGEGGLAGDGIEQGGAPPERELEVGEEVGFGAASGSDDGQAEVAAGAGAVNLHGAGEGAPGAIYIPRRQVHQGEVHEGLGVGRVELERSPEGLACQIGRASCRERV